MSRAKEVVPGIWLVGCGSWGGFNEILSAEGSSNVFLAGGEGEFILIDAGTAGAVDALLENCESVGASPRSIKTVILTHSHGDHASGAQLLVDKTGAKLAASDIVARALGGDAKAASALNMRSDGREPPLRVDIVLGEGDTVAAGPWTLSAMLTPGHIPGSVTLAGKVGGLEALFTGDSAIGDQGRMKGVVGWLDGHWGSNPHHMLASIAKMRRRKADLLLPGHGLPIVGKRSVGVSLNHCARRLKRLLAIPDLGSMMMLDLSP